MNDPVKELEQVIKEALDQLTDEMKKDLPQAQAIAQAIVKASVSERELLGELLDQSKTLVEIQKIRVNKIAAENFNRILRAAISAAISIAVKAI